MATVGNSFNVTTGGLLRANGNTFTTTATEFAIITGNWGSADTTATLGLTLGSLIVFAKTAAGAQVATTDLFPLYIPPGTTVVLSLSTGTAAFTYTTFKNR